MIGVALCRLPMQACAGCEDFFPDEQLEQLHTGCPELYCPGCVAKARDASDEARDSECYG